jgi:hypothetical protein
VISYNLSNNNLSDQELQTEFNDSYYWTTQQIKNNDEIYLVGYIHLYKVNIKNLSLTSFKDKGIKKIQAEFKK